MTAGFRARATKSRPTNVAAMPATAAKKSCQSARAAKRSSTAPPYGGRGGMVHATADLGHRQDAGSRGARPILAFDFLARILEHALPRTYWLEAAWVRRKTSLAQCRRRAAVVVAIRAAKL